VRLQHLGRGFAGGGLQRLARVIRWIAVLRRTLRTSPPDVVISFIDMNNVMVLLATRGLALPVIVSERVDPAAYADRLGRLAGSLRNLTYRWARRIVVQTRRAARFFRRNPAAQLAIIPNPVNPAVACARPAAPGPDGRWRIIGIGRFDHQKGFDILIDGFAGLAERFSDWDVVIFGDGPQREALQAQIDSRAVSSRISLRSPTKDIVGELARSHLMAFPSRFEGFPNALAEAMAAGLPAVAFADVSGVEDLIVPGVSGILAPWGDRTTAAAVQALSAGLASLMASADLRTSIGAAASAEVRAFAPPSIFPQWDELLAAVMRERAGASA
jgi:GalNAc-alpha-(1->4)-GalNAc-alpha-(1->3)-diNAcBac-PP-undecaprenol alpha-1,4-N-acetyl-D-galactosaminyltransferase